jgi:hypothetical protein
LFSIFASNLSWLVFIFFWLASILARLVHTSASRRYIICSIVRSIVSVWLHQSYSIQLHWSIIPNFWHHLSRDWLYTGFGLLVGFVDHLQIVTTINYSAISNSHILQFTTARTESSHSALSSPVVA